MAMAFTGMAPVGSIILGAFEEFVGLQVIILLSGICCFLASLIFEYYRPVVRKYARPIYIDKGIIKEIVVGIDSTEEQQVWIVVLNMTDFYFFTYFCIGLV